MVALSLRTTMYSSLITVGEFMPRRGAIDNEGNHIIDNLIILVSHNYKLTSSCASNYQHEYR